MFNWSDSARITVEERFDYHVIGRGWQSFINIIFSYYWDLFTKSKYCSIY